MLVLAIDPGNVRSAYCLIDSESMKPLNFGILENVELLGKIIYMGGYDATVIERIQSYGMLIGKEVLETCEWVGIFTEAAQSPVGYVYRMEEKSHICHNPHAGDSNIRRALIDRFATHDKANGKGSKKNPDFFYGFHADIWAAFAVGLTYIEKELNDGQTR